MPTLEVRMTGLEKRMDQQERLRASQDGDLADIGLKMNVQDKLLKSLAKTQSEHTATLAEHTATLAEHTATLAEHTATLAEHSVILNRHTAMHKDHKATLAQHSIDLHMLKGGVEQIIGMLDTLIERDDSR